MPEGQTIHRIAVLDRIEPYGKHLFYRWSTGEVGHVHLGLFGKFRVQLDPPPARSTRSAAVRSPTR